MGKNDTIKEDIVRIKKHLLEREPEHFSTRDLVDSFFGALILGITFTLKGLLVQIGIGLSKMNIVFIIISTFLILTAEIYFIGYSKVKRKENRPFGQFWLKRIVTFYCVAFLVSAFLVYVYGINALPGVTGQATFNIIIAISMPCAIGASLGDLLKRY